MAKKKSQEHAAQSFGNLVSRAAISQFEPVIRSMIQNLGNTLSQQNISTFTLLFTRIAALERLLIEKELTTQDELTNRVADLEDARSGLTQANLVEKGDVVRFEMKTKLPDQENFQGSTRLVLNDAGSGKTYGTDIEDAIVGMKRGESKEVQFGPNKDMTALISINRVARLIKAEPKAQEPVNEAN